MLNYVIDRYQENKIRLQRSVARAFRPRGNVRQHKRPIDVVNDPVKKRKRVH